MHYYCCPVWIANSVSAIKLHNRPDLVIYGVFGQYQLLGCRAPLLLLGLSTSLLQIMNLAQILRTLLIFTAIYNLNIHQGIFFSWTDLNSIDKVYIQHLNCQYRYRYNNNSMPWNLLSSNIQWNCSLIINRLNYSNYQQLCKIMYFFMLPFYIWYWFIWE